MCFGNFVLPWTKHVRAGRDLIRRAFEAANKDGDLTYASYCGNQLNTNLLAAGDPLVDVQSEAENGLAFAQKARFAFGVDLITPQLGLIRTLRGLTPTFGCFDDGGFDEARIERRFSENPDLAFAACWYWIRKLQARFFAADYAAALDAASSARPLLWTSPSKFEIAEYHFYSALSHAASCKATADDQRLQHVDALVAHHRQLEIWAANCPENFENRAALVGAEIARIEARALDAMNLYEQAIRSAQANDFVHNEALAYELAARFYTARGFHQIAQLYVRNARYAYLRWGADGKVSQLDELHPHLTKEMPLSVPTSTIGTPIEHLDLATVIKVSEAVSSEMVIEKLVDTLMRTAIEQAGAERGLLILSRGNEQRIEAEATTTGDSVTVDMRDERVSAAALAASIVQYVMRTRERVILDDASAQNAFSTDPYIRQHHARSILCLPLITQAKLVGALYFENNLSPYVFTPARISVLKLLASQAAISLENTRLYRDLAEREARIRRLVDSDIIGICIFDFEGRILDANDAFLRIVGYDRSDLAAGRVRWTELTPSEWSHLDVRAVIDLKRTGTAHPFEKEYFRKDGSRVPVMVGGARFEEGGNEGVAFVLDLTERKRAEAEARESERRYREVQTELAHANRLATMGQLTASIAHEVNQPITAVVANAQAGLRFLEEQPVDLDEVRQILEDITRSGGRAGEIVGRIRDLVKKAPPRKQSMQVNAAIREVIDLTRSEAVKNNVSVRMELTDGLPLIEADRVELEQVILNLIVNALEAMSGSLGPRELLISSARDESGGVLVAVRDSGPGLALATLEHVFEPFYTTKPSGLGMGLSLCRSIIEAHGGRLWAGTNVPRGAIFHFTLPAQKY
jgi:PAS domain S-box-containing protein